MCQGGLMEKQFLHAQMEKMHEGIELYSEIMNLFDQSDLNNPDDACRKAIDKFYIVRRKKNENYIFMDSLKKISITRT